MVELEVSEMHYSVSHDVLRVQGLERFGKFLKICILVEVARPTLWFWQISYGGMLRNGQLLSKRESGFWLHYSVKHDPVIDRG